MNLHPFNYLYTEANGAPSADAMDNDTGAVPAQFTQDASELFNYHHQQLLLDNRGFSSSLANINYHGNRDQPRPMIGLPGLNFVHNNYCSRLTNDQVHHPPSDVTRTYLSFWCHLWTPVPSTVTSCLE